MIIIPAIDLKSGCCVRLTQGEKDSARVYSGDPIEVAHHWRKSGAQMLHLVDLDGAFIGGRSLNRQIAKEIIQAIPIPVEFGGGIRSVEDAEELIKAGAAYVIIGTLAVERPDLLEELSATFGSKIVVGIDARDGMVAVRGWEVGSSVSALDLARRVADVGVERIIYTDVARDGMLSGPNIEMTRRVAESSGIKVTASGGISSLDDIRRVKELELSGVTGVIVGKALYEGRFTLQDAVKV